MRTRAERLLHQMQEQVAHLAAILYEQGEVDADTVAAVHQAAAAATESRQLERSAAVADIIERGCANGLVKDRLSAFDLLVSAWSALGIGAGVALLFGGYWQVASPLLAGGIAPLVPLLFTPRRLLLTPRERRSVRRRMERSRSAREVEIRREVALIQFRHRAGELDISEVERLLSEQQALLVAHGSLLLTSEL